MLQELSQLCDIIVEPLRDRIVTSLLQAALVCALFFFFAAKPLYILEFTRAVFFSGWLNPYFIRWRSITCILYRRRKTIGRRSGGLEGICTVIFEYLVKIILNYSTMRNLKPFLFMIELSCLKWKKVFTQHKKTVGKLHGVDFEREYLVLLKLWYLDIMLNVLYLCLLLDMHSAFKLYLQHFLYYFVGVFHFWRGWASSRNCWKSGGTCTACSKVAWLWCMSIYYNYIFKLFLCQYTNFLISEMTAVDTLACKWSCL